MNNQGRLKNAWALLAFAFVLLAGGRSWAQERITPHDLEKMQIMEDSMLVTVDSMYEAFLPDSHIGYSERFIRQLVKTLKIPNSYQYPFNKLKERINIMYADDQAFRIFNWDVDMSDIFKRYYGAIQLPSENLKLYGLTDCSQQILKGAEDSTFTGGKWYGAMYYRIMATEVGGHKMYTMFGYSSASPLSNKKILDPLIITDNSITFGAPVFGIGSKNFPRQPIKRFILEYKKGVHVSMNWDKEHNVIVFDNLSSQINDPNRKYTYVPSGQYDGFRWDNGMWNYLHDLIPINPVQDGETPEDEGQKK